MIRIMFSTDANSDTPLIKRPEDVFWVRKTVSGVAEENSGKNKVKNAK